MGVQVITVEDLDDFRLQLLRDIEKIVQANQPRKWLKTQEVMDMLGMSEVTLQTLRNKGVIPYRKIGGICYYNAEELDKAIECL